MKNKIIEFYLDLIDGHSKSIERYHSRYQTYLENNENRFDDIEIYMQIDILRKLKATKKELDKLRNICNKFREYEKTKEK